MAEASYEPRFPEAHKLLLDVYGNAMKSDPEASIVWCERLKALTKGWEALKTDGLLPSLFLRQFGEDVRDVAGQVHKDLDLSKLTEQQSLMSFGIANLGSSFGGR
jgi:hypothetical protein